MRVALLLLIPLLAGCASPAPDHIDVTEGTARFVPPAWQGLELKGTVSDSLQLEATVTNHGPNTYEVSAICEPVWNDRMERNGEAVQHRPATAVCQAFGVRDFPPGETISFAAEWDGRVYDDETASDAKPGAYTWIAEMGVSDGQSWAVLPLSFQLEVRNA